MTIVKNFKELKREMEYMYISGKAAILRDLLKIYKRRQEDNSQIIYTGDFVIRELEELLKSYEGKE